ncbi:hypothetical protein CPC16_005479, partial [Podila verticillata]
SLVETLLGGRVTPKAQSTEAPAKASTSAPEAAKPATTPSSTHSSPELRAADILKQREQRQNEATNTIEGKHSQLNAIESTLEGLHSELEEVIAGTIENKKQILLTEENLTKTMFKIDAIESDGDLSIRKRRKELIKLSQNMLDLVDEFKSRDKKSSAAFEEGSAPAPIEIASVEPESSVERGSETESAQPEVDVEVAELESLSDIESLPEVHGSSIESTKPVEYVESENIQEDATLEASSEARQSNEELAESDVESESSAEPDQEQQDPTIEDPLNLIANAALEPAHPGHLDHDFELVSVH